MPGEHMKEQRFFVGTYTRATESRGIYTLSLDSVTGALRILSSAGGSPNPSFLTIRGDLLFAAGEGPDHGALASYRIAGDGVLSLIDRFETGGSGTCHLTVSPDGRYVYAANYSSGSLFGVETDGAGRFGRQTAFIQHQGSGPFPERQQGPHAHFVSFLPDGERLLCCDLGIDRVLAYRYHPADGSLTSDEAMDIALPAGEGPRHFACTPNGRHLYIAGELSSNVLHVRWGQAAEPVEVKRALPAGFEGTNWPAHIELSRDGRFLYLSNRGHDSIAVFPVDPHTGRLGEGRWYPCGGQWPRHFALSHDGRYLVVANQNSNDVITWRLDEGDGGLAEQTGRLDVPAAVCAYFG